VEYRILGPLEVWDGERPVEVVGAKRRIVLALLVLHANEVVRTERLVDAIWGAAAPRNAVAALHNHVSRLRSSLGADSIVRREWGYVLRAEPGAIDGPTFERLIRYAEPLPARERAERLAAALALWRGPALADLADHLAIRADAARLDELRLVTLERRVDAELEIGSSPALVAELEALIAVHPLREHLRGQLILALYRADRQVEALEVYRETRRLLTEELGLEPSPALKELERAILRHDPTLAPPVSVGTDHVSPERGGHRRRGLAFALLVLATAAGSAAALLLIDRHAPHEPPAVVAGAAARQPVHTVTVVTKAVGARHRRAVRSRRPMRVVRGSQVTPTTVRTRAVGRFKHGVATTRATTTATTQVTATTVATTVARKPVLITDDFSEPTADTLTWLTWSNGGGGSGADQNGRLVLSLPSTPTFDSTYDESDVTYDTQCRFPGNFDARVDFALLTWPTGETVGADLSLFGPGLAEQISRAAWSWLPDAYASYPNPGSAPSADASGSLRIARTGGTVTTYFARDGQWRVLTSRPVPGPVSVAIAVSASGSDWHGSPVSVAFDNFSLTASDAGCPAGSDPRGP